MSRSTASDEYERGYAAGVRDATAWTCAAFGRLQASATHVEAEAKRLNDACRVELEIAQKRWAEQDEAGRGWPDTQQSTQIETSRARRSRKLETSDPGPTLNLNAAMPQPRSDADLSDEQEMRRAAARAWRR